MHELWLILIQVLALAAGAFECFSRENESI